VSKLHELSENEETTAYIVRGSRSERSMTAPERDSNAADDVRGFANPVLASPRLNRTEKIEPILNIIIGFARFRRVDVEEMGFEYILLLTRSEVRIGVDSTYTISHRPQSFQP
jgi:hypothetical protein